MNTNFLSSKSSISYQKLFRIGSVFIISIAFIVNSYILLMSSNLTSYEVSIYHMYPLILWTNFILIIVLTMSLLLLGKKPNILQSSVFVSLVVNQLSLLLLPLFRGYFLYGRSDVLEHLGRVKDILLTGHIGTDNFYPVMHVLIVELNLLGKASLNRLTVLLPAFFWVMLLLWYYIFIRNFMSEYVAKLSILSWMLFPLGYWHTTMVGNMFSYVFMFLILGVWISNISRIKKYLLTFILYLALVYFHPLTSIYLFLILILFDLINRTGLTISSKRYNQRFFPHMAIFILVIWFMWYLSFPLIQRSFATFWISIANPSKNPFLSVYLSNISRYHLSLHTLLKFSVYRYFGVAVFSSIAIFELILIKDDSVYKRLQPQYFIFMLLFIAFGVWSVTNAFLHFVNFERSLRYVVAFSLPVGSLFLFSFLPKRCSKALFVIILLVLAYFSVFTVHMSPLSGKLNMQVSASEYMGTGWLFYNRNISITAYDDGQITQYRFYEAWYGRDAVLRTRNILFYGRGRSLIPEHFGYNKYKTAGSMFSDPHYFIIGRAIWEYYNATMPNRVKYWRWYPWELKRLRGGDHTVLSIYSSPDLDIYLVYPVKLGGI